MVEETPRPAIGAGDVELELMRADGSPERCALRPTYNAARVLSAQSGGLLGAIERVARLEVDTIVQVVSLGLGYGTQDRPMPKDLPDRVWRTGLNDISGGVAERSLAYLQILMSGGRPARPPEGSDPNSPTQG